MAGLLIGAVSWAIDVAPWAPPWTGNVLSPWLAAAFLAGWVAGVSDRMGAVIGLVALGSIVGSYLVLAGADASELWPRLVLVVVVAGPIFGWAGAVWRSGRRRAPMGLLVLAAAIALEGSWLQLGERSLVERVGLGLEAVLGLGLVVWTSVVILRSCPSPRTLPRSRGPRPVTAERRNDALVAAVPVLLVVLTLVWWLDPRLVPALVSEPLDLVLSAAATLVAIAVAILAWIHYREGDDQAALVRASAFLVLAAQNLILIGIAVAGQSRQLGMELAAPGQLPLWSVIVGRGVAAALLVGAGLIALRPRTTPRRLPPLVVLAGPTLLVLLLTAGMIAAPDALPVLLNDPALAVLRADPTAPLLEASGWPLILLQAAIGLAFLAAALISYRLFRRDRRGAELYLCVGFVLAAFSQVHSAIHPGSYASLVTTGDMLRVAFYAVLLLAVAAEARDDIRSLRAANAELVALRVADVERATSEERARLAREIHDGMSQELWYAKLKQSRLAAHDELPPDARELANEVAAAIESALAEARQAILALRPAEGASFAQVMNRFVADFADRFGIPAECEADGVAERLPARHQAELLRILQEALTNVRRHADATRVRVRLEATVRGARLVVADNGRGFDARQVDPSRYGLRSMRERAAIIGADLRIESAASDGTRLTVEVPVEGGR